MEKAVKYELDENISIKINYVDKDIIGGYISGKNEEGFYLDKDGLNNLFEALKETFKETFGNAPLYPPGVRGDKTDPFPNRTTVHNVTISHPENVGKEVKTKLEEMQQMRGH